jgi:uncharacterized protein
MPAAAHNEAGAQTDHAAAWLAFLASPAAPKRAMSALELDGYLSGVVVAPSLIAPSRWMFGLWGDEGPNIDAVVAARSAVSAVVGMAGQLGAKIDDSLRRLEIERVCDYRPVFMTGEDKPSRDAVRSWVGGFWQAMTLAPSEWSDLAADERTQIIVEPFIGFIDLGEDEASSRRRTSKTGSIRLPPPSRARSCC